MARRLGGDEERTVKVLQGRCTVSVSIKPRAMVRVTANSPELTTPKWFGELDCARDLVKPIGLISLRGLDD